MDIFRKSLCRITPGFQNHNYLNHVYKLKKALHSLKQAPRAWYERLSKFVISNGFSMGN